METPRYIEIFEERNENGQSVLRYHGFDNKMHRVGDVQSLIDCMADSAFPNGIPNLDGKTRYVVTLNMSYCSTDNKSCRTASPYVCKLIPAPNYTVTNEKGKVALKVSIEMGGTDITSTAFNDKTGVVKVAEVTDRIIVTVTPQSH